MSNGCVIKRENIVKVSEPRINYEASFDNFQKIIDIMSVTYGENAKVTLNNVKTFIEESIVYK